MNATSAIEQVANAVLYEGFLLYPYRLSSVKNRHRWNFGVLYPEPFARLNGERATARTECLLEAGVGAAVDVKVRFLQLVDGAPVEREVLAENLDLDELGGLDESQPFAESGKTCGVRPSSGAATSELTSLPARTKTVEHLNNAAPGDGRTPSLTHFSMADAAGKLEVRARKISAGVFQLTASISNLGQFHGPDRDEALGRSLLSTHVILTARGGRFISLIEPPEALQAAAAQCRNTGLWPVLAGGDDSQMLSAPIILYDHPRIAPESPGDLFDGTEIDEILTLRIRTLSDAEKQEMRAADGRARALLERSEALTREELARLHAPMRREPEASFKKGDRVRLRPRRRADIFDIALAGKLATVVSVEQDFEDRVHLCVTVDDDPGKDLGLEGKPGHRFFFSTEEVERA